MAGLPFGEVIAHLPARFRLVLGHRPGQQPALGLGRPVRADGGGQRMVERLGVRAHRLDPPGREPLPRLLVEARGVGVVVGAVAVVVMPAGVDDDDVTGPYLRPGGLQVVRGDHFPLLLRDRHHHPGAEERAQRDLVQQRRALDHVPGRVDVRAGVHDRGDLLGKYPALRHPVQPLDLDVLEVRPGRDAVPPGVGQVVELQRRLAGAAGPLERHPGIPLSGPLADWGPPAEHRVVRLGVWARTWAASWRAAFSRVPGSPRQEAAAGLGAEITAPDQRAQQRARLAVGAERGQHGVVDGEGQVQPDVVRVLDRAHPGQPEPDGVPGHQVDRVRVADAVGDQGDRLAPQGVLQPVTDESGYVPPHPHGGLAEVVQERDHPPGHLRRRSSGRRSPRPRG